MKTSHPSFRCSLLIALFAGLAAGCAGPAAHEVAQARQPFVIADYKQVYVTGSHIPILVPKDPTIQRIPTISPLVILSVDDAQRSTGPTPFPMH